MSPVFNSAMLTEYTTNLERPIDDGGRALPLARARLDVLGVRRPARARSCENGGVATSSARKECCGSQKRRGCMRKVFGRGCEPPAPMTFARVSHGTRRLEFAHIASVVFSLPFGTAKRIYGATGTMAAAVYGWVGYFEGQARFHCHDCNRERCYWRLLSWNLAAASGRWIWGDSPASRGRRGAP